MRSSRYLPLTNTTCAGCLSFFCAPRGVPYRSPITATPAAVCRWIARPYQITPLFKRRRPIASAPKVRQKVGVYAFLEETIVLPRPVGQRELVERHYFRASTDCIAACMSAVQRCPMLPSWVCSRGWAASQVKSPVSI